MEIIGRLAFALALLVSPIAVESTSLRATARTALHQAAAQRVELISQSKFALESLAALAAPAAPAVKVAPAALAAPAAPAAKAALAAPAAPAARKVVSKTKEAAVLGSLEEQVKKLEGNVQAIAKMDKSEHSAGAQKTAKELRSHMKGADQKMLDKMDEWGSRMNRKTRLGAMDVISKLKNAIHLVKKGALTGNKDAADSLNNVLSKMGAMAGQPTGGNFLH